LEIRSDYSYITFMNIVLFALRYLFFHFFPLEVKVKWPIFVFS
jgi:hypothetical protein